MNTPFTHISTEHAHYFEQIAQAAAEMSVQAYVIGGYVRDIYLQRPCKDIDIVCLGNGMELAKHTAKKIKGATQVTKFENFGTAMFRVANTEIEFVGARRESYAKHSRKPIVENGTLQDDQNRRDFTINALAISLNRDNYGELIDVFGGIDDLKNGIIRTPLHTPDLTFSDDPLRMLRAVRFATQLNFHIHPDTFAAISNNANRLAIISAERIADEVNKIMLTPRPSIGFKLLFHSTLLHQFFPELAAMQGVEVRNGLSHKDNFYHTLQVLDNLCQTSHDLWLRWAALLHDIGKPNTKRFEEGEGWTFHGHEAVGADMVAPIFKRLKLPLTEPLRFVQKMVAMHQRPVALTKEDISDAALRRLLFDAGEDIDKLMLLCRADITSRNEEKVQRYLKNYDILVVKMQELEAKDHLRNWQPPISGNTIMQTFGIKPSREVGVIKMAIREAILEGEIPNDYSVAYNYMLQQGKLLGLVPVISGE
jgi:poly(A) polymerase